VPWDAWLPRLPGQASTTARHPIAHLLEELVDAAGCNAIPPPAISPEPLSIVDVFEVLKAAAKRFEVAPGVSLADHLWTHPLEFHNGTVAARLRASVAAGASVQGFLALYAAEVRSPLLYAPNIAPFRVRETIDVSPAVDGPFLVLIVSELSPVGRADAVAGYAMPIYHAKRFFPVHSGFDRDVLRALEHLQIALDAHGAECAIRRLRPDHAETVTRLQVEVALPGGENRHFRFAVDPTDDNNKGLDADEHHGSSVTPRRLKDGSFVAWLEKAVCG
jgi:hypothetical protein